MPQTNAKHSRLEARVTPEIHALLKRAAEIEGRTMTDFIVEAASKAARNTIEQVEIMRLSRAGQEAFASALINPPEVSAGMKKAFANRKRLIIPDA